MHVLKVVIGLQGEFVNGSRLEADYVGTSRLIHQMYIYGNPLRAYLLAVVVPSKGACAQQHPTLLCSALNKSLVLWAVHGCDNCCPPYAVTTE